MVLVNHGSTACSVTGYPTVTLTDDSTPMPVTTLRGQTTLWADRPSAAVNLVPGGYASAGLELSAIAPNHDLGTPLSLEISLPGVPGVQTVPLSGLGPIGPAAYVTAFIPGNSGPPLR